MSNPYLSSHIGLTSSLDAAARDSVPETHSDDEWEYEYSTTETEVISLILYSSKPLADWLPETHYTIIDLGPNAIYRSRTSARLSAEKNKPVALSATPDATDSTPTPSQPAKPSKSIQILDLHTKEPILSHDSHVYRLEWADDISSNLLFAPTHPQPTLLTTTTPRLLATPVTMVPKPMDRPSRKGKKAATGLNTTDHDPDSATTSPPPDDTLDSDTLENGRPTKIPLGPGVSYARRKQAHFLESLMAIKRQNNEEDEVTVYARRRVENPNKPGKRRRISDPTPAPGPVGLGEDGVEQSNQDVSPMLEDSQATKALQEEETNSTAWPGVLPHPSTADSGSVSQTNEPRSQASRKGRPRIRPQRGTRRGRPRGSMASKAERTVDIAGLWGG
ncbi:MAG: hypothetical protein M1814_000474 [Vezdaea aestivalis]|nr:MAG: hypothetical protein M1814_000474 [Vezdaea aestivalis]